MKVDIIFYDRKTQKETGKKKNLAYYLLSFMLVMS